MSLLKGIRQTTNLRSTIRVYAIPIFAFIFGLAGFLGIRFSLFQNLASDTMLAVWFISIWAFYFFLAHVTTRSKWEKFYNYTKMYTYINDGFKEIHHLHRKKGESATKDEIIYAFKSLCTYLADGFGIVTNSRCSVCIKILVDRNDLPQEILEFKTLCRDQRAEKSRKHVDEKSAKNDEISHTLNGNTAFIEALGNEQSFISNKLPLLSNYENTSARDELYGEFAEDSITKIWNWPLPYVSTVVVPIVPLHSEYSELNGEDSLVGFLCLDSKNWGVFNKEVDVEILRGIADGIFNTLVKFKEVVDK